MDSPLTLTAALGEYPNTRPLKEGSVSSDRLSLQHVAVTPITRAFRMMANDLAFDVSEMAMVTYLLAKSAGRPVLGVPAVVLRLSPFGSIVCHARAGIREPKDLEGRRLGVRAYTQTTGAWLRGILQDEYGVKLDTLHWVTTEDAHVKGFQDPPNVSRAEPGRTLADLLLAGEIDATVGAPLPDHPDLRPLFPDAERVEARWSERTGCVPVNHIVVVKRELAEAHPWLPDELYQLLDASRLTADEREGTTSPASGLEANRAALATLSRYACEQGIIPRTYAPDELFVL